jgi:uncharacterized membrane protein
MSIRSLVLPLVAIATLNVALSAQALEILPTGTWANDVTPDGELIVGSSNVGGFMWRWRDDPAPTYIPGGDMLAVSDDGSVVLGNIQDGVTGETTAALWTEAGGWVSLGGDAPCGSSVSTGYALSGDGKSAVGLVWASGCDAHGFLWTEAGGMTMLDSLGNGVNRASAISRDGQVIGGFAQGSFNRTPAVWSAADGTGWLYDINAVGEVHGMGNDGSTLVGEYEGQAFRDDGAGVTLLGSLNGGHWIGIATDISEDGETIVGYDVNGLSRQAWMWTTATGIVAMDQVLSDAGFPSAPDTWVCRAVSDDGNVIVGGNVSGVGGPFGFGGFIYERETVETWIDLGNALAGTNGEPHVTGSGSLDPFSPVSLTLSNALPSGQAYLVFGFSQLSAPFKGGVLEPNPDLVFDPFPTDGAGGLLLSTHWPGGVPSGFTSYMQFWIPDAGGPKGFAASNGLAGTTP